MTDGGGGSDLGAGVETIAIKDGESWLLTGEKYFAGNAGAELAEAVFSHLAAFCAQTLAKKL